MRQEVNLYTDELRPSKEPLQASTAVVAVVVAAIAIAASAFFVRYQERQIQDRLQALNSDIQAVESRVGEMTDKVESQQVDSRTIEAVSRITAEIAQRRQLLAEVARLVGDESSRFSPYMTALARQVPDQLWLTGFSVNLINNQVRLSGRTRSGDQVPVYLERLGREPVFGGRRFERLMLQRSESGSWIDFKVASDRDAGDDS
jgi:MSHA biogenesis protein MshI